MAKRTRKYDWDALFNGDLHVVQQGVEFDLPVARFRHQVLRRAAQRHICVHTLPVDVDRLAIRACGQSLRKELAELAGAA